MKKKLERIEEQKVLAGVLAGLADYFDKDPVLFRLAAIVLLVLTGFFPGVLIYLGAWFIMPVRSVNYRVVE